MYIFNTNIIFYRIENIYDNPIYSISMINYYIKFKINNLNVVILNA